MSSIIVMSSSIISRKSGGSNHLLWTKMNVFRRHRSSPDHNIRLLCSCIGNRPVTTTTTDSTRRSLFTTNMAMASSSTTSSIISTGSLVRTTTMRTHYTYSGPGRYGGHNNDDDNHDHHHQQHDHQQHHHHHPPPHLYTNPSRRQPYTERGYTVGIGGPVGSGKTHLVLALIERLAPLARSSRRSNNNVPSSTSSSITITPPLGVVTNDIFTQEDAQFLHRKQSVLNAMYIKAVETGGCPHAAIREDVSANLTACEDLTAMLQQQQQQQEKEGKDSGADSKTTTNWPPLILCESGGDNLAANFSRELADLTLYVIDVAGGDKVPRKGGPGITQSDLLIVNKIDLADAVGADLNIMKRDADWMRRPVVVPGRSSRGSSPSDDDHDMTSPPPGPTIFASVKHGTSLDDIEAFILQEYEKAVRPFVVVQNNKNITTQQE